MRRGMMILAIGCVVGCGGGEPLEPTQTCSMTTAAMCAKLEECVDPDRFDWDECMDYQSMACQRTQATRGEVEACVDDIGQLTCGGLQTKWPASCPWISWDQ